MGTAGIDCAWKDHSALVFLVINMTPVLGVFFNIFHFIFFLLKFVNEIAAIYLSTVAIITCLVHNLCSVSCREQI